ncbi:hypothetical protein [Neobacillus vireti]|uniref:hypothetical protein n=1 Tax=Neobacillus vireti TaxID=220686 RepID=UPI002FFEC32C
MSLSLMTKKKLLQLFLKTSVKRIVIENKLKKESDNPCYACIEGYLKSKIT